MRRMRFLVLVSGLALLPLACSDDSSKPKDDDPPAEYLEPTSIINVLANLARSIKEMEYEEYVKLLDPAFTFVFNPEDAGHNGIPNEWGLADEKISVEHMFGAQPNRDGHKAYKIEISFIAVDPVEDPQLNPDWMLVRLLPVDLRVQTTHKDTGDILIYEVREGQADLYFAKTGSNWKIIRWVDLPVALNQSAVASFSWGLVKWAWR